MEGLAWTSMQREEVALTRIVCESAAVTVALCPTGNGARLKLISERSGASVLLDATVLDALCSLTAAHATELVKRSAEGDDCASVEGDL